MWKGEKKTVAQKQSQLNIRLCVLKHFEFLLFYFSSWLMQATNLRWGLGMLARLLIVKQILTSTKGHMNNVKAMLA